MCLGIPGKVVEIREGGPLRMALVDYGGARKEACLEYLPAVQLGDYVIVHVGFAISKLDEEEALRTIELLRMLDPRAWSWNSARRRAPRLLQVRMKYIDEYRDSAWRASWLMRFIASRRSRGR